MLYNDALKLIGNTPLVELKNIKNKYNLNCRIFGKVESYNLTGSVKDRAAFYLINELIKQNKLNKDSIIAEATSGNMGISLAAISSILGYKSLVIMPSNMSEERIKLIKMYGADIILTDASLGMGGSIAKLQELMKDNPNIISLNQFSNTLHPLAHLSTGKEIYQDLNSIDILVAGVGTGATISGIGTYLKEQNKNIQIIAVEPATSNVLTGGTKGGHVIQGIGAGFIPDILNKEVIDKVIPITDEECFFYTKELVKLEGLFCGLSSGAALAAAIKVAKVNNHKDIVVILPDSGMRYLSTKLFEGE